MYLVYWQDCDLCEDERFSRTGICVSCDAGLCRTYFHITWWVPSAALITFITTYTYTNSLLTSSTLLQYLPNSITFIYTTTITIAIATTLTPARHHHQLHHYHCHHHPIIIILCIIITTILTIAISFMVLFQCSNAWTAVGGARGMSRGVFCQDIKGNNLFLLYLPYRELRQQSLDSIRSLFAPHCQAFLCL